MPAALRPFVLTGLLAAALAPGAAAAFEVKVTDPGFTVTVPRLPEVRVQQHAAADAAAARVVGDDGTVHVDVFVTPGRRDISTRECAGRSLRAILAQPGMPDRDNVYRVPLSADTFLVLYLLTDPGHPPVLHAHLLAAVAGSHCTEAHFSRPGRTGEDMDDWRRTFSDARIEGPAR